MFYHLLFLIAFSASSSYLPLDSILKAHNAVSLKQLAQQSRQKQFLEKLCRKQKEMGNIPKACYQLSLKADPWCLNLRFESPKRLKSLKKALKSKFLSKKCREHLKEQEKILNYKQADFLLPELKNYFTVEKPFF